MLNITFIIFLTALGLWSGIATAIGRDGIVTQYL